MNRVQVILPIIDSKRKLEDAEKSKKLTAKPQIGHQGKDLIVVYYVRVVWNLHFEAVSCRKEDKREGGDDIPTQ